MIEKGIINVRQFTLLVIFYTMGTAILLPQAQLASYANQSAWLAAVLGVLLGLIVISLYVGIYRQFKEKETFVGYLRRIVGRIPGTLAALIFIFYLLTLATLLLREVGDFVVAEIMHETPIQAIQLPYLFIVILGARLGLETYSRAAEVFFPWTILLLFTLVVLLVPEAKPEYFQPVTGIAFRELLHGATVLLGIPYLELIVFLWLVTYVNKPQKVGSAFIKGGWIGGIPIVIFTLLCILVLGYRLTDENLYPSFILAKHISVANFLERLEAVMTGIWFLALYFKFTITYYGATLGLSQVLGLKDYRPLTYAVGTVIAPMSLIVSPNIVYFNTFIKEIWTPFSFVVCFLLPLLIFIIGLIRAKPDPKGKDQASSS